MKIQHFFDPVTYTLTYIVFDEATKDAVLIDPVLDYEANSGKFFFRSVEKPLSFIEENSLNVHYIMETHAHADHLSSSVYLKEKLDALVVIGESIRKVQETFKEVFNISDLKTDGSQFDVLLKDGEELKAGSLVFKAIHTPGHTPACMSYLIEDCVFTGDALFMPDYGTGRCDFPQGSAKDLYHSVHEKLYKLPDETRVFTGHDYQPGGRELEFESTIGENKKNNVRLTQQTSEEEFVKFRTERDSKLTEPKLLYPSIQVNIRAGHFPEKESNGMMYLKIPFTSKD